MFLARIRESTQAFHSQLEHDLDLFHAVTTLESYISLLQKFLGFYLAVEPHFLEVQNQFDLLVDLHQRLKSPLLLRDLGKIATPQDTNYTVPLCETLPVLTHPAQVWGCLYVLEGSTLGGTLISRHINNVLGLTAEHGCAFFCSYGSHVGSMWQRFTYTLEAYASTSHEEHVIIDSARETFAILSQWLLKE